MAVTRKIEIAAQTTGIGRRPTELVAGIKRELLPGREVIEDLQRRVRRRLKDDSAPNNAAEIARLEREVARLVDTIASGTRGASAAIAQRLKDSEVSLARMKAQPTPKQPRSNCCRSWRSGARRCSRILRAR